MTLRVECSAIAAAIGGAAELGAQELTVETMLEKSFIDNARAWFSAAPPLGEIQVVTLLRQISSVSDSEALDIFAAFCPYGEAFLPFSSFYLLLLILVARTHGQLLLVLHRCSDLIMQMLSPGSNTACLSFLGHRVVHLLHALFLLESPNTGSSPLAVSNLQPAHLPSVSNVALASSGLSQDDAHTLLFTVFDKWDSAFDRRTAKPMSNVPASSKLQETVAASAAAANTTTAAAANTTTAAAANTTTAAAANTTTAAAVAVAAPTSAATAAAPAASASVVTPGAPESDGKGGKKRGCSVL